MERILRFGVKTFVQVLNTGRCHDKVMLAILREITMLMAEYNFSVRAEHLTTDENRIPDIYQEFNVHDEITGLKDIEICDELVFI